MNQDPHHLVTGTELWLEWAADHGVRYDDTGKSFDDVARDYYQTSDSYRELAYADLGDDALTAFQRAAANVAYARTLLIEAVIGRRGGDLDAYVDPIEVLDPNGRGVPRHRPHAEGEFTAATASTPEPLPERHGADADRGLRR